jgi:hypothetical protein
MLFALFYKANNIELRMSKLEGQAWGIGVSNPNTPGLTPFLHVKNKIVKNRQSRKKSY